MLAITYTEWEGEIEGEGREREVREGREGVGVRDKKEKGRI
jgi:hypothetical protein